MQRRDLLMAASMAVAQPALADIKSTGWPPDIVLPLWPDAPPGAADYQAQELPADWRSEAYIRNVAMPTLNVFRSQKPNGQALLVMPGGAYHFASVLNEGVDVGRRFSADGVTVFVLVYRMPGEGWKRSSDVPLQDAQRAMRLIKHKAASFGVDPAKVGVLGFSAGGHLAATLATAHDAAVYRPVDDADRQSARPAHAGLIYPVITMTTPHTHALSRKLLLGAKPSQKLVAERSAERHVTAQTPPCFVVHAYDDDAVPVENSLAFIGAMRAAKRPVEAHLLETGRHAFGLGRPGTPSALWPDLFQRWFDDRS